MKIDRQERARARLAAMYHEASHAVIAALHGAHITTVEILDAHPAHSGRCSYTGLTAAAEAAVTLAGPVGEARWTYGARPSPREVHSVLDGNCLADGSGDYDKLTASGDPLPWEVGSLVETCWPAIRAITQHLIRHDRADHTVICAALGIPETDGHLSAQASAIRAGLSPTPQKLPAGSTHSPACR